MEDFPSIADAIGWLPGFGGGYVVAQDGYRAEVVVVTDGDCQAAYRS